MDGLTHEEVAGIFGAEGVVPVNFRCTGAGQVVGGVRVVEAIQCAAGREHPVVVPISGDPRHYGFHAPGGCLGGKGKVPNQRSVVVSEPLAEIVSDPSLLAHTRERLESTAFRLEAEIALSGVGLGSRAVRSDRPAEETSRAVDPAIEAPTQSIDPGLEVVGGEARQEHVAGSLTWPDPTDFRRGAHQHSVLPGHQSGGEGKSVGHDLGPVHASVSVGVAQHLDPPSGFHPAAQSARVVGHLADPKPPVGPEIDRHRRLHQVVAGHQVHGQSFRQLEAFQGAVSGQGLDHFTPGRRRLERRGQLPLHFGDDLVLQGRIELLGLVVIPKRRFRLVAPFL